MFDRLSRSAPLLLACALWAAWPAGAQVYKNVMPDGSVVYSDKPMKGAGKSSAMDLPPPPTEADKANAAKRAQADRREKEALHQRLDERRKKLDAADARVAVARQSLASAETALQQGLTPLPGEMKGNVGPTARPSEAYLERIANLERNVETAKKELSDALRARDQAR
jgi:Domain of unknown function (DUF4124)